MAQIESGSTATLLTVDPTSTAARITEYDQYGNATTDVNSLGNILNLLNSNATVVLGGQSTIGINVAGTTGTLTLSFEATIDNSTWVAVSAVPVAGGATVSSTTANGQWIASTSGFYAVRARISAFTSGSMTVSLVVTQGVSAISLQSSNINGTVQPLYGASGKTITITLASLANAGARASTAVSNTTALYEDVYLFVKLTTGASGVATTGYVNVYGYGSVDGGTTYPEGITGTDAGVTLTSPPNLVLIAQINANTSGATKTFGPFSFCRMYGLDRLPALWGVVVLNETGAAFNATAGNFLVEYQGVNGNLV